MALWEGVNIFFCVPYLPYCTLYHIVPYCTILYHTLPYFTILYYTVPLYSVYWKISKYCICVYIYYILSLVHQNTGKKYSILPIMYVRCFKYVLYCRYNYTTRSHSTYIYSTYISVSYHKYFVLNQQSLKC